MFSATGMPQSGTRTRVLCPGCLYESSREVGGQKLDGTRTFRCYRECCLHVFEVKPPSRESLAEHRDAECPVLADDNLFAGELDRPERD